MSEGTKPIFFSYSHEDEDIAEDMYRRLDGAGFDLWMDRHELLPGENWLDRISNAVNQCAFFLVLLSSSSVKSRWVKEEVAWAMNSRPGLEERIVPIVIEPDIAIPTSLSGRNFIRMPGGAKSWREFHRFVNSLPGGRDIPRVFDATGRRPKAQGVLVLGEHPPIHAEQGDPESIDRLGAELAKAAWPYVDEAQAGIVTHGFAGIALAMLAHLWGLHNAFPRIYWPHRQGDRQEYWITARCSLDLQTLRETSRKEATMRRQQEVK